MKLGELKVTPNMTAKDIKRAKSFYEEKVGMEVEETHGGFVLMIKCGDGTSIAMYEKRDKEEPKDTAVTFVLQDLEAMVDSLTKNGVLFEKYNDPKGIQTDAKGISGRGGAKAAWFKDSEGNIIGLIQPPVKQTKESG